MPDWANAIVIFLGGGGFVGLLNALIRRRKVQAEARGVEVRGELQIVDSSLTLVHTLQEELGRLTVRVAKLEADKDALQRENNKLKARCTVLENQVKELGGTPHAH